MSIGTHEDAELIAKSIGNILNKFSKPQRNFIIFCYILFELFIFYVIFT